MPDTYQTSLLDDQVEEFGREGFLILPGLFSGEELAPMRAESDRMIELVINCSLALGELNARLERPSLVPGGFHVRKVQPVNDLSALFAAVSADERLIGPMRRLMGVEPVLMEEKLNCKQSFVTDIDLTRLELGEDRQSFPLHHDWGYYRYNSYPDSTISSAISLDPSLDRGPLRVVPGTHRQEFDLRYEASGEVDENLFGDTDKVAINAPAGSVMFFHSRLLHDSVANTSGLPRRIMIYSHYPTGAFDAAPDERNAPLRNAAIEQESRYRALVERGEYVDAFHIASPTATS